MIEKRKDSPNTLPNMALTEDSLCLLIFPSCFICHLWGPYMFKCVCVGHYIPQLAIALLDHNAHSTGFRFNIKGVAVREH
jgi:hypothetical protein